MTLAPWSVPYYGAALFVANTGDGRINTFDLWYQTPIGNLIEAPDTPLVIDGLRDLSFGFGLDGSPTLYFSAGPNGGRNGTFGSLVPRFVDVDPPEE